MKPVIAALAALLVTSAAADLGNNAKGIGKPAAPSSLGTTPTKAPPPPTGTKVAGQADLRITKVEHKVVLQGCKPGTPFVEVVATVKNKGGTASAGLSDPSAIGAVFKVDGQEKRFSAVGGLMPLPPDATQVVVMKVPYAEGLFPVEKLPDGWTTRKHATRYQIQVNAAGLIDENKAGDKGVLHTVEVTKEQCPDLFHTLPPFTQFEQFQSFCQQSKDKVKLACALASFGGGPVPVPGQSGLATSIGSATSAASSAKLPSLCNACKAACPECFAK